jgi:hypothetical protein
MTSECQPNQAHSATVDRHVPILITPDVVSSSTSEAVTCCMPSTVWDVRLRELLAYKEANGNTLVPQVFPSNKQLGIWVQTQRYQFKLLHENKKSAMTEEHIKSLNELDFDWRHGKAKAKAASWEDRLQELAAYKEANGSTNVTQEFPSNKQLGIWVKNQRTQYRLFKANEKSNMTKARMESLNELDFEWKRPLFWSYP